ncbi:MULTISPECIES: hypothetical protein [unclassified Thalassospira]|uniref:hypothetical protein n=1 Tax=unclassified Thalassospira TaxID=2648997 RepID=UPI001B0C7F20|nr:hypothetical protein [Thalassospira sp.]MBO6771701.1 hypothetical protein [Thalassospira sp.]
MIIFSSSSRTFRPVLPAPETAAWFNNWRFNSPISENKNFGFGEENVFTCPTCKRLLPTAYAEADHMFPQKALRRVMGSVIFSYTDWTTFSAAARSANKKRFEDDDGWSVQLKNSAFKLPDYEKLRVFEVDAWDGGYDQIKMIAQDVDALARGSFEVTVEQIRVDDMADNAVRVHRGDNLTFYYDLARFDVTNIAFLCSVCNHAKAQQIYPAHKGFVTLINRQRYLEHITEESYGTRFLADNTGPTYSEQRDMT